MSEDIESLRMNTAVSALMILLNEMEKTENVQRETYSVFLWLLAPFAPHIAEELWQMIGGKSASWRSIHTQPWPQYDEEKIKEETFQLVLQVNSKVRGTVEAPMGISKEEAEQLALSHERVIKSLDGKTPKKVVFVPGRLVNVVI